MPDPMCSRAVAAQAKQLWRIRENISEALKRRGPTWKYDLSCKMGDMYRLVEEVRARLQVRAI